MRLIFLYGPPAAGKLTVGKELAKMLNVPLLDNHKVIDYLPEIFPRDNGPIDVIRSQVGRKVRLDVFEAAARANIDLVTTFAPLSPGTQDFMRASADTVERAGGTICFVQLLPSREALLARVAEASRKGHKIDTTERWHELVGANPKAFEAFADRNHLVIDNSTLSPAETARKIVAYYALQ